MYLHGEVVIPKSRELLQKYQTGWYKPPPVLVTPRPTAPITTMTPPVVTTKPVVVPESEKIVTRKLPSGSRLIEIEKGAPEPVSYPQPQPQPDTVDARVNLLPWLAGAAALLMMR